MGSECRSQDDLAFQFDGDDAGYVTRIAPIWVLLRISAVEKNWRTVEVRLGRACLMSGLENANKQPALAVRQITKIYGSTQALSGVNLTLHAGKIHAIMGENGAGKSTLIKVLVGAIMPTSGDITLGTQRVRFNSVSDAIAAGVVPIYQHLTLFDQLTVLENLYSFETSSRGVWRAGSTKEDRKRAHECLAKVGLALDLNRKVSSLKLGERQLLEIARGINRNCKVLLLDEPTAALNSEEAERLLTVIRQLAKQGVAIAYISHKSDEIRSIADEISVLRDGKSVIEGIDLSATTVDDLVHAMLGHEFSMAEKILPQPGEIAIEMKDIVLKHDGAPISISVRKGEIVGLVGLAGGGSEEIGGVLAGAFPPHSGKVVIEGQQCENYSRKLAVSKGVGYVPPDRHKDGLFAQHSAINNASASVLRLLSKFGFVVKRDELKTFEPHFEALTLSPNDPQREICNFSGGNQQKVLISRAIGLFGLKVLILSEPTRGVDIGARDKIHDSILAAAHEGKAVLLITSDLEELTSLVHRTLVVMNDQIKCEMPQNSLPDEIAIAMQGQG